ncbi:hypothetical protein [Methylobacterium planeticum]|uniref:Glycosyltransferase RgtA/B/C/D-like domain-containing protein n=1 Tax=Methylobacterium planeticum TaxID=2615211 RepID=A0A6N6MT14_9HYPH|nr:hypothetical protein [Methylobacterium planeticum]KAB1074078.1 hypothetical protein F6X51_10200 [Methylobacterium planeticum]
MAEILAAPRPMPVRRLRPDGATLVLVGVLAFLASQAGRLLGDPDTQWHVAVGARIVAEGALPWVDRFSHTFAGAAWIAKEWLSQVLLYGAFAAAGWPGVALLTALVVAGTFALMYRWLCGDLAPTSALVAVLLAAVLTAPHLLARPHVLSFPVILLTTCALVGAAERRAGPPWWVLGLFALWANLHAGFTIGFAVAGLIGLEAVAAAPAGRRAGLALRWGMFLAAMPLAACATPYGPRAMLITITLFGSGEPLPYIQEWQPLDLDTVGILAGAAMLALLLVLAREGWRNLPRIVLLLLLGAMTLRHGRFLDLFALIAPILAAAPLARWLPPRAAAPVPAPHPVGWAVAALLLALPVGLTLTRPLEPDPAVAPRAALDAARRGGLTAGPVYNSFDFGGFLIGAGVPTFVDGRADQIFLGGFTRSLNEAIAAEADGPFLDILSRHGVTWALVQAGSPEARHLARAGWTRIHADAVAAVFGRPGAAALSPAG